MAAALGEVLSSEPIVVGGLAQDYYTAPIYHQTDLDLCAYLGAEDKEVLQGLEFIRDGRHWFHEGSQVAVEFPDDRIDGDETRTVVVQVGGGSARIIGLDDLYLDRVRQATATGSENNVPFQSALAIAAARYVDMDWKYIQRKLHAINRQEPMVGREMLRVNRGIRSKARRAISEP